MNAFHEQDLHGELWMQPTELGSDAVFEIVGNLVTRGNTDSRRADLLLHNLELKLSLIHI